MRAISDYYKQNYQKKADNLKRLSAFKIFILYLAMMDITMKWTGHRQDWGQIHSS